MKKHDKRWYLFVVGIILIVVIGAFLWVIESSQTKGTMTEQEFKGLTDKEMEIVDTSVFLDEELKDWYYKNRKVAGEYTFPIDDSTYILVSVGEVEDENTFLLLNGVKEVKDKLVVSYETLKMENSPNIEFEDNIRSTLIKVEGNYQKVEVVQVVKNSSKS